jgi:ActR/RegA family two-component response regulator
MSLIVMVNGSSALRSVAVSAVQAGAAADVSPPAPVSGVLELLLQAAPMSASAAVTTNKVLRIPVPSHFGRPTAEV